jgi:two-component system cell cycle sensor histidine kinase/response regulator CckA
MLLIGLALLSTALQLMGAVLSLWLMRSTRWRGGFLAVAVAFALMATRSALGAAAPPDGSAQGNLLGEGLRALGSLCALYALLRAAPKVRELLRSQDELLKVSHTLRAVIDASPVAIVALDEQERVTIWSSAAERIFGWKAEEVLGRHDPLVPADKAVEAAVFSARVKAGEILTDLQVIRSFRDGSPIELSFSTAPLRGAAGNICGRVGLALDVRERNRAQAARALFERAVDQSIDGIAIAGADRTIEYVNPALSRLIGYSAGELVGAPWPEIAQRILGRGEAAVLGRERRFVGNAVAKDGSRLILDIAVSPLQSADGALTHEICALRDVSRERQIEEQLQQAQKMEVVGRLAGGVAHDFNNLLTAISGYATIALGRLRRDEPAHNDIQEVLIAAERAANLSRQLLAFSRKEAVQARSLNLDQLVANLERMLRRLLGEDLEVAVNTSGGGWVKADPGHLEQVIVNLALNARDAMPRGGRITIATACVQLDEARRGRYGTVLPGRWVKLSVTDTGHGMGEEILAHLFEPFFTTKEPGKGTGLGLATVYGIVQRSGGAMAVESRPGQGSMFELWLPRIEAEPAAAASIPAAAMARGDETVLVVEDESGVRELACRLLTAAGYHVLSASNGAEAIRVSGRHAGEIDLVLTDVIMPGLNGRELAERLRSDDPDLKILFMSGYTDSILAEYQGMPLMPKPFSGTALTQAVRDVLDERPAAEHAPPV